MANWGDSFLAGLQTGHSLTQGLIDQYREDEARRGLLKELEGMEKNGGTKSALGAAKAATQATASTAPAADAKPTKEKGWMESTTEENLAKIDKAKAKANKYGGAVLDQLSNQPREYKIGNVPVEDRSTPYRPNDVLPTDTGVKTVRNTFKVGDVVVEDASTPYYKNEIQRQAVEGRAQPQTTAILKRQEQRGPTRAKAAQLKRQQPEKGPAPRLAQGAPTAAQRVRQSDSTVSALSGGRSAGDILASGAISPKAIRNDVDNPRYHPTTVLPKGTGQQQDGQQYTPAEQELINQGVPPRFVKEEAIARARKATDGSVNVGGAGQGGAIQLPPGVGNSRGTINLGGEQAPAAGGASSGDSVNLNGIGADGAIQIPGQGSAQAPAEGEARAIQGQPGQGSPTVGGPQTEQEAADYYGRQRRIMMAEARYLLQVDPRSGIQVMKQINQQDAQYEFSGMLRGAMSGDVGSLTKMVEYLNLGSNTKINMSQDGTFAEVTGPDGQTQKVQITPQLIAQVAPQAYVMHMAVSGLATDKAIEMMQSMDTLGLNRQKTQSEIDRNNAYADLLRGKAAAAGTPPAGMKLFKGLDADGQEVLIDQITGRIYDQESGILLPKGFTKRRMAEVRAKYGDDARFGTTPDGVDVIGTTDGRIFNLATGEELNPNRVDTTSDVKEPGADDAGSLAVDMIKGFEGFRETPYADYRQMSIGYGTRAAEGQQSITEPEALEQLKSHIQTEIVPKLAPALEGIDLTPAQQASLVSLCYNVGTDTFLRSNAFKALQRGDMDTFVREVMDPERGFTKVRSAMGGLQVSDALVARRRKEMEAFLA